MMSSPPKRQRRTNSAGIPLDVDNTDPMAEKQEEEAFNYSSTGTLPDEEDSQTGSKEDSDFDEVKKMILYKFDFIYTVGNSDRKMDKDARAYFDNIPHRYTNDIDVARKAAGFLCYQSFDELPPCLKDKEDDIFAILASSEQWSTLPEHLKNRMDKAIHVVNIGINDGSDVTPVCKHYRSNLNFWKTLLNDRRNHDGGNLDFMQRMVQEEQRAGLWQHADKCIVSNAVFMLELVANNFPTDLRFAAKNPRLSLKKHAKLMLMLGNMQANGYRRIQTF
jgi:hypothetical protein